MPKRERVRRIGFWYRLAVLVVKPLALVLTRRRWLGMENLPATGGVIVAANHYSYADPFTVAHAIYDNGRLPRFLAKAEIFRVPVIGALMRGAGQIPVHRHTADAGAALVDAVAALQRGECVVIYPEGTVTRDPDRWPMAARTGIARLVLATGCPVLPLAQWGAQVLHDKRDGLHLRRAEVVTRIGPPIELSGLRPGQVDAAVLREVTDKIMQEVRRMVGELRGQQPPAEVFGTAPAPAPAPAQAAAAAPQRRSA